MIRRATAGDIDALVHLRLALFHELHPSIQDATSLEVATRHYLMRTLPAEEFLAWVVEEEDDIVACSGLVLFRRPPTDRNLTGIEAYVMNMYTVPEYRGSGLAQALLREITQYVRQRSIKYIWLRAA